MKNKEIIDKLQAYFLESDPAIVARSLAAMMIDLHRLLNVDALPESERECLFMRLQLNEDQLMDFIKNGPRHSFTYHNIPSQGQ